jgi:hypothetical protein
MDGLNSCYKIFDHMTMTMMGSTFQHNTAVCIFSEDFKDGMTEVFVGSHPRLTWLGWGSSKNGGSKKRTVRRGRRGRNSSVRRKIR